MAIMLATEDEDAFVTAANQGVALASAADFAQDGDGTGPWIERLNKKSAQPDDK